MVLIYIYIWLPVHWPLSVLCVCVCVILNQNTSKNPHVSDLSKRDALLHKTQQGLFGTKAPRFNVCRSIISLSKMTL